MKDLSNLLARIFLASIFVFSAVRKLLDFSGTASFMQTKNIPASKFLLGLALLALILGSLSIILGYRMKLGAVLLILFLIPTTLIFHPPFGSEAISFLKNLGLIGGLMILHAHGPGKYSLQGR